MATFIGFSTVNRNKQFTVTDFELIKIDLLNAFNIKQGQVVGRPQYGTVIWNYLFENQSEETERDLYNEIQRVCGGDPRVYVNSINLFPQQNGILIEVDLMVVPSTDAQRLNIFFNQEQRSASYV
jgi:phage baseplate assembly protein W